MFSTASIIKNVLPEGKRQAVLKNAIVGIVAKRSDLRIPKEHEIPRLQHLAIGELIRIERPLITKRGWSPASPYSNVDL